MVCMLTFYVESKVVACSPVNHRWCFLMVYCPPAPKIGCFFPFFGQDRVLNASLSGRLKPQAARLTSGSHRLDRSDWAPWRQQGCFAAGPWWRGWFWTKNQAPVLLVIDTNDITLKVLSHNMPQPNQIVGFLFKNMKKHCRKPQG